MGLLDNIRRVQEAQAALNAYNNSAKTQQELTEEQKLAQSPYHYSYTFGDWITGNMAAGKQAEAQAALDAREWQRNEYSAQQQRAFEEYMDSTKVQRSMADLQAAGLNPWLAVQSAGFGGAVPSGAAASSSAGQVQAGDGGSKAVMGMAATAYGLAKLVKVIAKYVK